MTIHLTKEGSYVNTIEENGLKCRLIGSESIINQAMNTTAITQLINMAELPEIKGLPIGLPDIHQGYGFPIGSVVAFDADQGIVSPGGVGYDINCGVALLSTGLDIKTVRKHMGKILDDIYKNVPVGMARSRNKLNDHQIRGIASDGLLWMFNRDMALEDDLNKTQYEGSILEADADNISQKAYERGKNFFGSLGSGNHFLEFQYVDETYNIKIAEKYGLTKGMVYVMLHTGSRGLGHQVATDFMKEIRELPHNQKLKDAQISYAYIGSKEGERYLGAMNGAANYAFANKQLIINLIRESLSSTLGKEFNQEESRLVYNISHNLATFEKHQIEGKTEKVLVHRKGATKAFSAEETTGYYRGLGHPVLVPGSMGTSSYVLQGLNGNSSISLGTSCHGAGRIMGRKKSNESFTQDQVKKDLTSKEIQIRYGSENALTEESPGSYKDIDEIVLSIEGAKIAGKVAKLIPMGVIKG
jgi:tRNA-splicing ligase RtcB